MSRDPLRPGASAPASRTVTADAASRTAAAATTCGAALALALWTALAVAGLQPFHAWHYHFAWYTALVGMDAGLAWREGRWPLLGRPGFALSLLLWSVPAWLLFEAANLRLANWYYVLAEPEPWLRRAGTGLAFATVLPALYLCHRWAASLGLARGLRGPRLPVGRATRRTLLAAGAAFVILAMWRPAAFYPLLWGAVTLLVEPWNHRASPRDSLLGDLAEGRWGRPVRLLAAGAAAGLLWEALNAPAQTRWIYTVPGLEGWKLFEMPLPGYLGFPVFALDGFVLYRALVNLGVARPGWAGDAEEEAPAARHRPGRTAAAALLAAGFSALVVAGVERHTVDSYRPGLEDLPAVDAARAAALRAAGVEGPAALAEADPADVAERSGLEAGLAGELVAAARLSLLRGIGARNAELLAEAGVGDACALAAASQPEVTAAVRAGRDDPRAGHPPRVRVWLRAAREACPEGTPAAPSEVP